MISARYADPLDEPPKRGYWRRRRSSRWAPGATRGIRHRVCPWRVHPDLLDLLRADALRIGCQPGDLLDAILRCHLAPETVSTTPRYWIRDTDRLAQALRARQRRPSPPAKVEDPK